MKYIEVLQYCLSLPGTRKESETGQGQRFTLLAGDEPFALFETGAPIQWQFLVRATEADCEELYDPPHIRTSDRGPGHWLVILRVENFDDERLKALILWSYEQAVAAADAA